MTHIWKFKSSRNFDHYIHEPGINLDQAFKKWQWQIVFACQNNILWLLFEDLIGISSHTGMNHTQLIKKKRLMCRSLRKNDIIYKKRYPIKINNVFFSISGESFSRNDN